MPNQAGEVFKSAVKNAPKVVAAITAVSVFLKNNPGLPTWLREQFDAIPGRIKAVQHRRGDAARIRGTLTIIRDVARDLDAHEGERFSTDAASWIREADHIELGVRLAETQDRPEQRKTLARLRTETDALLAELIDAMARVRPLPALQQADDEPGDR